MVFRCQDDDESYDSYEDDDDSYDSYDDDQESSEDDDGGGERTIIPPRQKTPPQKMSPEAKEAIARRKEEREKYTRQRDEDRRKKGLPPIKEPDEPPRFVIGSIFFLVSTVMLESLLCRTYPNSKSYLAIESTFSSFVPFFKIPEYNLNIVPNRAYL